MKKGICHWIRFLEKLLAIVSPILLGIIGYFSPKLIEIIKRFLSFLIQNYRTFKFY